MQLTIVLDVNELEDIDDAHEMGITNDAYERLVGAITGAGYSIVAGPEQGAYIG